MACDSTTRWPVSTLRSRARAERRVLEHRILERRLLRIAREGGAPRPARSADARIAREHGRDQRLAVERGVAREELVARALRGRGSLPGSSWSRCRLVRPGPRSSTGAARAARAHEGMHVEDLEAAPRPGEVAPRVGAGVSYRGSSEAKDFAARCVSRVRGAGGKRSRCCGERRQGQREERRGCRRRRVEGAGAAGRSGQQSPAPSQAQPFAPDSMLAGQHAISCVAAADAAPAAASPAARTSSNSKLARCRRGVASGWV